MSENPDAALSGNEQDPDEDVLMLLIDPQWRPTEDEPKPSMEVLLGAWVMTTEGGRSLFQPNPYYQPMSEDSPLDPADAVLRLLARDGIGVDKVSAVLRDVMLGIAVDERGVALVRPAPDGVPSVLVTTSYGHRRELDVPRWLDVSVRQLAEALPPRGVDVLLNPGSATSMRMVANAIREAAQGQND